MSQDGTSTRASAAARPVTLAQVAHDAGVSLKTASRALAGERYVTAETKERVVAAARTLGYRRNAAASLLASGRAVDVVGLITGDLTNPFYAAMAQGVEAALGGAGLQLAVASSQESPDQEWAQVQALAERRSRGIVVVSAMNEHSRYEELQHRGVPVVFADRPVQGATADSVVVDNRGGGRMAARHLLARGHRRIAFIGDFAWLPTFRDRVAGMGEVLDGAAPHWRALLRSGAHDVTQAREQVHELATGHEPPTAYVAGNNRGLLGVVEELAALGDVDSAVLGFDDVEWARVLGLTVVATDARRMGEEAGLLLLGRDGGAVADPRAVVLPVRLIARGSGERVCRAAGERTT